MNKGEKEVKESFWRRIRKKRHISVSDLNSFEVSRHLLLSPWHIFTASLFAVLIVMTVTCIVIAYTPLRQFIPGYPDISEMERTKRRDIQNMKLLDEIDKKAGVIDQYNKNLIALLNEQQAADLTLLMNDSTVLDTINNAPIAPTRSSEDSLLRLKVAATEKYNLHYGDEGSKRMDDKMSGVFFFAPLKGSVSKPIDVKNGQFGVDLQAPKDEVVKAALNGAIIYTDWSPENGHVIHVQHSHNLVTVYMHNSFLLKKTGDLVTSGEPIAIVGSSGPNGAETHLHFELWYNGLPLNPTKFITF